MSMDTHRIQTAFICRTNAPNKIQMIHQTYAQTMLRKDKDVFDSHMVDYKGGLLCFFEGRKDVVHESIEELVKSPDVLGLDVMCEIPTEHGRCNIDHFRATNFANVTLGFLLKPAILKRIS